MTKQVGTVTKQVGTTTKHIGTGKISLGTVRQMSGTVINQLLLFVVPRWQPGSCKNPCQGLVTYGKGYQED